MKKPRGIIEYLFGLISSPSSPKSKSKQKLPSKKDVQSQIQYYQLLKELNHAKRQAKWS